MILLPVFGFTFLEPLAKTMNQIAARSILLKPNSALRVDEENTMKHASNLIGTVLVICACSVLTSAVGLAAEDGAALFKSRCAGCHGPTGEGKPAMKAPSLKATTMDANQISEHLTKGAPASKAPHNKAISGLKPEQAKAIAEYVKTL